MTAEATPRGADGTSIPYFRLPHFDAATREAAKRGVFIWLRQSTPTQVRNSPHSAEYQRQFGQAVARSFELPDSMVIEYNGLGETGRRPLERREFQRMLRDMSAGRAGILVFADGHRVTRNGEDGELLIRVAREQGVLFVLSGLSLNPDVANDAMVLRTLIATAEFASASSIDYSEFSRLTAARGLRHLTQLPSPMIWGDPTDPRLRDAMTVAGAPDLLQTLVAENRLDVRRGGSRVVPMPYPSAEALRSIELRFRWLWKFESVSAVYDQIMAGADDWPHPGLTPRVRTPNWTPDLPLLWAPALLANVRRWFTRPALYGIYHSYHRYFLPTHVRHERKTRVKGLHHHRKVAQLVPPLPSAYDLIRAARPTE